MKSKLKMSIFTENMQNNDSFSSYFFETYLSLTVYMNLSKYIKYNYFMIILVRVYAYFVKTVN